MVAGDRWQALDHTQVLLGVEQLTCKGHLSCVPLKPCVSLVSVCSSPASLSESWLSGATDTEMDSLPVLGSRGLGGEGKQERGGAVVRAGSAFLATAFSATSAQSGTLSRQSTGRWTTWSFLGTAHLLLAGWVGLWGRWLSVDSDTCH